MSVANWTLDAAGVPEAQLSGNINARVAGGSTSAFHSHTLNGISFSQAGQSRLQSETVISGSTQLSLEFQVVTSYQFYRGSGSVGASGIVRMIVDSDSAVIQSEGGANYGAIRGDTDLDGRVDFKDLLTLAQSYESGTNRNWFDGDLDGDGSVGFGDLLILAQNYGAGGSVLVGVPATDVSGLGNSSLQVDWTRALSLVPEPAALYALTGAGVAVGRRKRL